MPFCLLSNSLPEVSNIKRHNAKVNTIFSRMNFDIKEKMARNICLKKQSK